jgi:hypothetical protein
MEDVAAHILRLMDGETDNVIDLFSRQGAG